MIERGLTTLLASLGASLSRLGRSLGRDSARGVAVATVVIVKP
jgi:hypothetical protein